VVKSKDLVLPLEQHLEEYDIERDDGRIIIVVFAIGPHTISDIIRWYGGATMVDCAAAVFDPFDDCQCCCCFYGASSSVARRVLFSVRSDGAHSRARLCSYHDIMQSHAC
jgi:hypothetical protein